MTKKVSKNVEEIVYRPNIKVGKSQELIPENNGEKGTCPFLYLAAFILNLMTATLGIVATWTSPVTLKLLSTNPEINPLGKPITTLQLSLLGSLPIMGNMIGFLLFAKIFDIFGRRKPLIAIASIIIVFLLVIAFSTNIYAYFISLTIIGAVLSGVMLGTTMYSSEISEDHNRAKFVCFIGLGMPIGSLFDYVIGPLFSVKVFTLLCALPPSLYFVSSLMVLPESPIYLLSKGDIDGAKRALSKLRNRSSRAIGKEIEIMELSVKQISNSEESDLVFVVKDKATRRGLIISTVVCAFSLLSGAPPIMTFLELIFEKAGTSISSFVSSVVVGIVQVICIFGASFAVDFWGRRPLLLVSSVASSLPLFLLGAFFYLKQHDSPVVEYIGWLPLTSVISFLVFNVIGFASVPMVLLSEIFPINVKSIAICFAMIFNCLVVGLTIFLFPIMMETFGLAWVFWTYGIFCLLAFIFIYCCLPETKGKNILEIQEILRK